MDFYTIKNAVFLGIFLSFMIGPIFFMLIQTSILKGVRAAIAFDIGAILGDVVFINIAYFGSRRLLEVIKDDPRLFFIGGCALIVYGLITYFDRSNKKETGKKPLIAIPLSNNYLKLLLKGFFLNVINIGVLGFWLGLIVVIGPTLDMNPTLIFWYFATVVLSYFIVDLGKIFLAKKLKTKLTPGVIYKIKKTMGILLVVFGMALFLKGFMPTLTIDALLKQMN